MKLTFRRHQQTTGLAGVGNPYPSVDVKADGCVCGMIEAPNWTSKDGSWQIRLMVMEQDGYQWNWKTLKFKGKDEQQCRDFLKQKWDTINEKHELFLIPKGEE